eukprot:gene39705-49064_t
MAVGVYGKKKTLDTVLREHDRVEVYRPLIADPKNARRRKRGTRTVNTVPCCVSDSTSRVPPWPTVIARAITVGHGGTLEVESDTQHGTVFTTPTAIAARSMPGTSTARPLTSSACWMVAPASSRKARRNCSVSVA